MGYRVGSVPYINAVPLTHCLVQDFGVEVLYDVPSRLPYLLDSGKVDAILVSGIFPLLNEGLKMASGVGIASFGRVMSVLVYSKVPLAQVTSLALDQSSMTSNRLALEVLGEHGSHPRTGTMPPDLNSMLEAFDACVLIGDVGMAARGSGFIETDLGEEWSRITGLPFLWAPWVGRERLTPELAGVLREAAVKSGCGRRLSTGSEPGQVLPAGGDMSGLRTQGAYESVVQATVARGPFNDRVVREYFSTAMVYEVGDLVMQGYEEYARRISAPFRPELVVAPLGAART